jgi:hypothetical protein
MVALVEEQVERLVEGAVQGDAHGDCLLRLPGCRWRFISAALIPAFGWQSVFYTDAIARLLILAVA